MAFVKTILGKVRVRRRGRIRDAHEYVNGRESWSSCLKI
jgi:hypothetical protein